MKLNVAQKFTETTHEGAQAARTTPEQQLRRSVAACMLWESSFYEDGEDIAKRIAGLIPFCRPEFVAAVAFEARTKMKMRHVPLLVVREMARLPQHKALVGRLLADVIQRPDEIAEFLAIYWKQGREKISKQVKLGLARAFPKFNEYSLAKHNRDGAVKLRDALFLCHARPKDDEQAAVWKRLVDGTLVTPDTWEVALSGGANKKATFERLMADKALGALAFLRNLRNMKQAGVDKAPVVAYAQVADLSRVLPFRFVAAAKACPGWEDICDAMLLRAVSQAPKMPGKTVIVVDVSGSMYNGRNISAKSDITRVEAAGALAAIMREVCEDARIYATAGNDGTRIHATAEVPARRGMALVEKFTKQGFAGELGGGGIFLHQCLAWIKEREHSADRLIVFTDEQDCDLKLKPETADAFGAYNYLLNISVEKNGIGYKPQWVHIDGFSEAVIDFIRQFEQA